jgi:hypothetical protein
LYLVVFVEQGIVAPHLMQRMSEREAEGEEREREKEREKER